MAQTAGTAVGAQAGAPEKLDGIDNQVLIQVVVNDGKLHMYPDPATGVVIYHVTSPGGADPAKPHQVRWLVSWVTPEQEVQSGLPSGQKILITAKTEPDSNPFGWTEIPEVSNGLNSFRSGRPTKKTAGWKYNLELWQDGKKRDVIDPVIIIKDDP